MKEEFKFYYVNKTTREKVEVPGSKLIIERPNGESLRLNVTLDNEIVVTCDNRLVIRPTSSNQIVLEER
jgi:hypothetical protein